MPGFKIPTPSGTIGSHGIEVPSNASYYYSYTWQIFQLFNQSTNGKATVHLRDTTLPTFTANQDTYLGSSLEYKWAKSVTWDDIKVTWYDTIGLASIMREWRDSVWRENDGLQVASVYKKRSQIDVYTPDGMGIVTWCLIGSWPKIIKQGELTYTESNVKLVEVTVTYDWATEDFSTIDEKAEQGSAHTPQVRPSINRVQNVCSNPTGSYPPNQSNYPPDNNPNAAAEFHRNYNSPYR